MDRGGRPSSYRPRHVNGPLEGRRLWEIGSWGNASDHIGQRWEVLGREALRLRIDAGELGGALVPDAVLITLVDDERVQRGIQGLGLTNPDALLARRDEGRLLLHPIDFKWSIETATYRQISADALRALLDHAESPLRAYVAERLGLPPSAADVEPRDGLFFCPDSRPNRAFLGSSENRRQEYPLAAEDVVLEGVAGRGFFDALPWWPQALFLAELDRVAATLDDVDGAERYYRLGAGLGGALVKLKTPIFATEPAASDVPEEATRLLAERRFRTGEEIIQHLRGSMADRDARVRRLKDLIRCPYGYGEMLSDLAAAGVVVPERSDGPDGRAARERWGAVHRAIAAEHRAAVQTAGMALLRSGQSEVAALDSLARQRGELGDASRRFARATLRRELAQAEAGRPA